MKINVIDNRGYYENEDLIISTGKNGDGSSIFYMCLDKKNKDTMPLGACIWCHKKLE